MRAPRFRPATRDVFFYTRVVGQRAARLLVQVAFVSGGGEVVLSTFAWRAADEHYTRGPIGKDTLRLVGPATPSMTRLTPLIAQICSGAHAITVNLDVQRELLPPTALALARRVTELPDRLNGYLSDAGSSFSDIDATQDAATIAFRILYLWSGALPTDRHMPMLHESWAGLERSWS